MKTCTIDNFNIKRQYVLISEMNNLNFPRKSKIIRPEIKNRIEIIKEYDPHFPSIECNVGEVNQVFMNLISNATQAIEDKGKVRIKTWKEGNTAYVSISDNGKGMNETTKAKIFEPFFTTKKEKGTGLGLTQIYNFVTQAGGDIQVKSALNQGTTFTLYLPRYKSALKRKKAH